MRHRFPFVSAGLSLVLLALLAINLHAWFGSGPSRRSPVPEASAQAAAAKIVKEVYGDEYAAAKTATLKRELAGKLLSKAGETQNDLPGRYVLLRSSRDIALQAGDVETALLAVEQIDRVFDVNGPDLKREVLAKSAALASTPAEHKVVAEKCLALIDRAVSNDDFQVAAQFGTLAVDESAKGSDQNLARQAKQRLAEIEELARIVEKTKAARAVLDKQPDDPQANFTVGGFLCFAKGRWDEGLPMLALGNDPATKAVAVRELNGAKTAEAQVDLADQWRDLAEAQPAAVKKSMRERALFWYRKSLPGLTGLLKGKAQLRIKELGPKEIAIEAGSAESSSLAGPASPGESSPQGGFRRWQTKGSDSSFDARLERVEHATVVLKKKADDQIVRLAFDNLSEGDQAAVSDWTLHEADRIWELATAKIGARESRESVKAKELAKALDGACLRTVFSIAQTTATEQGKSSAAMLKLSGPWESKLSEIVLPLPQATSAQITRDARLVVLGRLNIKYAACPACGGTGMAKCPNCSHGVVYRTQNKSVLLPTGQRIVQSVQVEAKCPTCGGTGYLGECKQHTLPAWEPFGTRKLPQGSFFTFTDSKGARRVCFTLDDPRIQIQSAGKGITLRRADGKVDIQSKD